MQKFKTGDIVCLTIGSEPMRVVNVYGSRLIECEWKGKEGRMYKHYFRPDSLLFFEEDISDNSFTLDSSKKDNIR